MANYKTRIYTLTEKHTQSETENNTTKLKKTIK